MNSAKQMTVDQYISNFPDHVQKLLKEMRVVIIKNAPEAVEGFSYEMPSYKTFGKPLVYFAGYDKYIGFYATPNGNEKFKAEIAKYKHAKGSIQFPIDEPLPIDLITRIVKFRVEENEGKYGKVKK